MAEKNIKTPIFSCGYCSEDYNDNHYDICKLTPKLKIKKPEPISENRGDWIQTFTGKSFFPLSPNLEDICIEDIAHALSLICRFNGHSLEFYSVAQHCILVSQYCSEKNKLAGLLHDASEAYICDIPRPLKHTDDFARYRRIESLLQSSIYYKYQLTNLDIKEVKDVDLKMLATEKRDLMAPSQKDWSWLPEPYPEKITPLSPKEAEELFLKTFFKLTLNLSKG